MDFSWWKEDITRYIRHRINEMRRKWILFNLLRLIHFFKRHYPLFCKFNTTRILYSNYSWIVTPSSFLKFMREIPSLFDVSLPLYFATFLWYFSFPSIFNTRNSLTNLSRNSLTNFIVCFQLFLGKILFLSFYNCH